MATDPVLSKRERVSVAAWSAARALVTGLGWAWLLPAASVATVMSLEGLHTHRVTAVVLAGARTGTTDSPNDQLTIKMLAPAGARSVAVTRLALGSRPTVAQLEGREPISLYCAEGPLTSCFADRAEPWRWAGLFAASIPAAIAIMVGYRRKSARAVARIDEAARARLN